MAKPTPEPPDWKRADPEARAYVLRRLAGWAETHESKHFDLDNDRERGLACRAAIALLSKEAGNG